MAVWEKQPEWVKGGEHVEHVIHVPDVGPGERVLIWSSRRITRRRNAEEKAALGRGASIPFRYQLKPAQEPKRHRLLGSYAALRRRKSRLRQEYKGGRHIAEDLRA